jgi:hypothetical protein
MEETIFVYDGLGKLVAEYSTQTPPQNPTTNYTITDQLDSPRVITDSNGNVTSRQDFMPFGEELAPDGQNRTTNQKHDTNDNIRQRFADYHKKTKKQLNTAISECIRLVLITANKFSASVARQPVKTQKFYSKLSQTRLTAKPLLTKGLHT